MDIDSKRFRIKWMGAGNYLVTNRETKETNIVPASEVQSAHAYAVMPLREFDKDMERLMSL